MCHIFAASLISRCKGTASSLQLSCKVVFYSPAEIKEIKEIMLRIVCYSMNAVVKDIISIKIYKDTHLQA